MLERFKTMDLVKSPEWRALEEHHSRIADLRLSRLFREDPARTEQCCIEGNRPYDLLFLDDVSPKTIGTLCALYEQSVYVQGGDALLSALNPHTAYFVRTFM
jgi:glucose-6-phosphate isomerase